MHEIREEFETAATPVVISGCVGPRGVGYEPSALMTVEEAARCHETQVRTLRDAGADLVSAFTMNYLEEAAGIAQAAAALGVPAARTTAMSRPSSWLAGASPSPAKAALGGGARFW